MIQKADEDRDFILKEYARVDRILGTLNPEDQFYDDFKSRLNILEVFRGAVNEAIELEKEEAEAQAAANTSKRPGNEL